jgi:hypothetical protein
MRFITRSASAPLTRYLCIGEMSNSVAWLRMAKYSASTLSKRRAER